MGHNSFGTLFRITTWGESHGEAIGVVIDGCPAGLSIKCEEIQVELDRRAPGNSPLTSPRKEQDRVELLSGLFEGVTTGAPISLLIRNCDAKKEHYSPIKELLRPGHANATYLQKYGIFDWRGGGRASARETACRVAAGAVAKKLIKEAGMTVVATLKSAGGKEGAKAIAAAITSAMSEGDSIGGVVSCEVQGAPPGLGDPLFDRLEANLAKAMLSIPATKAFAIGTGFEAAEMKGSSHNDRFISPRKTATNRAGGTLGGISTGMPIYFQVAFKPTSTIAKPQETVDCEGNSATLKRPQGSRHDPCVALRAVPVVEAMTALVLADALLLNRSARL